MAKKTLATSKMDGAALFVFMNLVFWQNVFGLPIGRFMNRGDEDEVLDPTNWDL